MKKRRWIYILAVLALGAISRFTGLLDEPVPSASTTSGAIEALFEAQRSDEIVTVEGRVDRELPNDEDGSRHQRFIVRLDSGRTVLVAHNIDLAPPVPLSEGDRVEVRGEYEWNDRGGVLHWTHHDPAGRHPGGWIRWKGQTYE